MTATATERLTKDYGVVPCKGSFPQAANTLIYKGTFVSIDSAGRANPYAESSNGSASLNIVGVAAASFDNRTTAPEGGGAGSIITEVEYGVREFPYSGTAPTPGCVLWAIDNQTVSIESACTAGGGTSGLVGYCVSVDTTAATCRVLLGPTVVGQIVIASGEASQLDTAQAQILALQVDAESTLCEEGIRLGALRLNSGAAIGAFADNTTDGFSLVGSECHGIRWNNDTAARITLAGSFEMPADADDTAAVVMHFRGFRVGSADAAMVGTVTAFAQVVGAAYDADANAGGSTTAFDGATTVVTDETLSFAAGVLPAGSTVSFTFVPSAALDGDDFVLSGIRVVYTRAMRVA
jgi:hypothetical protein